MVNKQHQYHILRNAELTISFNNRRSMIGLWPFEISVNVYHFRSYSFQRIRLLIQIASFWFQSVLMVIVVLWNGVYSWMCVCCCFFFILGLTTKLENGKNETSTLICFWYLYYCYGVSWEYKYKFEMWFYRMQKEATRTVVNGNSINQHFCPIFTEKPSIPESRIYSPPKPKKTSISVAAYSKWKLFANWRFCRNCATSNQYSRNRQMMGITTLYTSIKILLFLTSPTSRYSLFK